MKKRINLLMLALVAFAFSTQAQQGGGGQKRTVEERVKMTMERLSDSLKVTDGEKAGTMTAFTDYYTAQDKLRAGMEPGTRPDRTQFEKLTNDRDEALKKVWTADQFTKYKAMEAAMRQNRGGGQRQPQSN